MRNRKLLIIASLFIFFCILLYMGLGYLSSYIGYYGYNKDKFRRFSENIEESKSRGIFIRTLNFSVYPDSFTINNVFIERGYRWGSSFEETRELDTKGTVKANRIEMPYQVVVSFPEAQFGGTVKIGSENEGLYYSPYIPIKSKEISDTVYFHLIYSVDLEHGVGGVVKVWK
jgi:hypothetical protein